MLYRFRRELIAELQKEHEVVLSMPFVGHEEDFMNMGLRCIKTDVDRRGLSPKTDFKLMMSYKKLLKEERPDMVITYSIKPNIYAGLACSMLKIPFSANVQGLGTAFQSKGLAAFVTMLYKTAMRKAKVVFFENEGNAQEFINRKILPKSKISVLPGAGINLESYALSPYPQNDKIRFLYLGRIMKEKGIDELLYAAEKIHQEYPNVIFELAGSYEDDYKALIEEKEQAGIVRFLGYQKNIDPFYARASAVVMPSYHEGMSNVILEAAATGRPVLASDIPGCREGFEDGVTGMGFVPRDCQAFYEVVKRFLNLSYEERKAMGQAGRRKIEREFDRQIVVESYIEEIKEII